MQDHAPSAPPVRTVRLRSPILPRIVFRVPPVNIMLIIQVVRLTIIFFLLVLTALRGPTLPLSLVLRVPIALVARKVRSLLLVNKVAFNAMPGITTHPSQELVRLLASFALPTLTLVLEQLRAPVALRVPRVPLGLLVLMLVPAVQRVSIVLGLLVISANLGNTLHPLEQRRRAQIVQVEGTIVIVGRIPEITTSFPIDCSALQERIRIRLHQVIVFLVPLELGLLRVPWGSLLPVNAPCVGRENIHSQVLVGSLRVVIAPRGPF